MTTNDIIASQSDTHKSTKELSEVSNSPSDPRKMTKLASKEIKVGSKTFELADNNQLKAFMA